MGPEERKFREGKSGKRTLCYCPLCNEKSLFWNYRDRKYECLNISCRAKGPSPDRLARPPWYKKSRRKFLWGRKSLLYMLRKPRSIIIWRWNSIPISVRKLLLSLLVIIGLVLVARNGYLLFTHQTATVRGTIIFLAELGLWIWIISILRSYRYRRRKPSFKLVFFSLLGIGLVCAFAGIEPLASYKERTIGFVGQGWETVTSFLPSTPTRAPEDVASAAEKVEPAVIRIETEDRVGSGMVVDKLGYVLTCNHVVEDAQSATITLMSGKQYEGSIVGRDTARDLAIIKIAVSGFDLPVVTLGNSDKLQTGEDVIAIGYALGLEGKATVSKGIISAIRNYDGVDYIQTDAAINPGNSGGPLINLKGEVVGIANSKVIREAVEGMSFAIAINSAKPFIADEIEKAHQEEEAQREEQTLIELEEETFRLINVERNRAGAPSTNWDAELYKLSKAHTQEMADRGELFHTPIGVSYGENCWGGKGYYHYNEQELAKVIVDSWMSSPLHRAWLLHEPLRTSVVSIVITPDGQYASWTFWMSEVGEGPALVRELSNKWMEETGGSIPWIEWLRMKGYL